ncbi:hypothetical protein AVEN_241906-1 [Araneus ventricosus]|uniref:Uncharacterized protein n=1 Tax=Araneus ventricosus TaxID=182803 RepID=A0A4Y2RVG8_ARAVE|nr:hypothetical protein AVEN_241906-1 [Araneus ventricosus]
MLSPAKPERRSSHSRQRGNPGYYKRIDLRNLIFIFNPVSSAKLRLQNIPRNFELTLINLPYEISLSLGARRKTCGYHRNLKTNSTMLKTNQKIRQSYDAVLDRFPYLHPRRELKTKAYPSNQKRYTEQNANSWRNLGEENGKSINLTCYEAVENAIC